MSTLLALFGLGLAIILLVRDARSDTASGLVFIFSAVHVLYVFPKVLALSISDSHVSQYFSASGTTTTVSYMALSCYMATILVYKSLTPKRGVDYGIPDLNSLTHSATRFSVMVGGAGLLASLYLVNMGGGLQEYFGRSGFYQMELSGPTVWLIFASRFLYPAIAVIALLSALKPRTWSILILVALSAYPIMNIILLFRRSDLLYFGFILFHVLLITGRLRVSRTTLLAAVGVGAVAIVLFPYLRQDSISIVTGHEYAAAGGSFQERLLSSLEVTENHEITRASSTIERVDRAGDYGLGGFVWNSFVNQFLPATLVGPEFKSSLLIGDAEPSQGYFDTEAFFYVAPMGFAEAYEQFGLFGWIIFAALGALVAVVERNSWKVCNRIFLLMLIPTVCLAASNDISSVPARLATFWVLTRFLGSGKFLLRQAEAGRSSGTVKILTQAEGHRR